MKKIINHLKENWIRHGFETLVVTIGILGAFTLNNWNESRKNKIKSINYLTGIAEELRTDTATINAGIESIRFFLRYKAEILESSDLSNFSTEWLSGSFGSADLRDYPIKNLTFSRIDDIGVFETIDNAELIEELIHYYSLGNERFQGAIDWDMEANMIEMNEMTYNDYFERYVQPIPNQFKDGRDVFEENNEEFEPPFLPYQSEKEIRDKILVYLQTPKIRNIFVSYYWRRSFLIEIFLDKKRETIELLKRVEAELNEHRSN